MQACHFWIFSSRLVLACLQTGCGKSPQKSLKTACTFISLDLFSVSLGEHPLSLRLLKKVLQENTMPSPRIPAIPDGFNGLIRPGTACLSASSGMFAAIGKVHTGRTPEEYIDALRLERAQQPLLQGDCRRRGAADRHPHALLLQSLLQGEERLFTQIVALPPEWRSEAVAYY